MPVQKLNKTIRDEIYQKTRAAVSAEQLPRIRVARLPDPQGLRRRAAHDHSGGLRELAPCPAHLDDGVSPTHFSHELGRERPEHATLRVGSDPRRSARR